MKWSIPFRQRHEALNVCYSNFVNFVSKSLNIVIEIFIIIIIVFPIFNFLSFCSLARPGIVRARIDRASSDGRMDFHKIKFDMVAFV